MFPMKSHVSSPATTSSVRGVRTIDGDYFIQAWATIRTSRCTRTAQAQSLLDSLKLKTSQIDAAYPVSSPRAIPRRSLTLRAIQFAKALGCPCVDTTDGARKPAGYSDKEVMALIKQYYRVVLEWAERYEIISNVEPHGPYTTNPGYDGANPRLLRFAWLRLNLDTGNTFIAGQDPVKFLKPVPRQARHCHIKDVSESLAKAMRGEEKALPPP